MEQNELFLLEIVDIQQKIDVLEKKLSELV